jgi:hypothetical protein
MSGPGAIAQLGERLHGMQEVVGSSPTSSITGNMHRIVGLSIRRSRPPAALMPG